MSREISIDGVLYREVIKDYCFNPYKGVDTECGKFKFTVLVDDLGDIINNTQSILFGDEYWDNIDFLRGLANGDKESLSQFPSGIEDEDKRMLIELLKDASKRGWL